MWWNRNKNKSVPSPTESEATQTNAANQPANQPAQPSQPTVEEDAVLLPPGASTDDPADGDANTAPDANGAKDDPAGATTEGTTPVPASTTTPATDAAPATPATTNAAPPPATNAAEQHPVLAAAIKDGIDTDAKYAQLSAEAAEGRAAIKAGRAEATAAATARYGTEQPEKLQAAERMIAATNSVEQLSMLTENYLAGAPGANTPRNGDGSGKRVTASQTPAPGATTETGAKPKPAASASNGGAKPDPYAQYNSHK